MSQQCASCFWLGCGRDFLSDVLDEVVGSRATQLSPELYDPMRSMVLAAVLMLVQQCEERLPPTLAYSPKKLVL